MGGRLGNNLNLAAVCCCCRRGPSGTSCEPEPLASLRRAPRTMVGNRPQFAHLFSARLEAAARRDRRQRHSGHRTRPSACAVSFHDGQRENSSELAACERSRRKQVDYLAASWARKIQPNSTSAASGKSGAARCSSAPLDEKSHCRRVRRSDPIGAAGPGRSLTADSSS